jgi:phage baseplate assembly protein gpV
MPVQIDELEVAPDQPSSNATQTGQSDGSENTTLVGTMRRIAETEARRVHTFDLGLVTSVFPHATSGDVDNYFCSVRLRDSDSDELRNVPVLTQHIGMAWTPDIGDLVLIGYIGGSINSPVVLGSMYNDQQRPPVNDSGELVLELPGSSDSSKRRLYIKAPGGIEIIVTDEKVLVDTGSSSVTLNTDGTIALKANADITIESTQGLKLKGATVSVESDTNMTIKGGAVTEIKGRMVNIN